MKPWSFKWHISFLETRQDIAGQISHRHLRDPVKSRFKEQATYFLLILEQLECLRSEDTPAASWLPTLLGHIGSQVKRRQSQSYKFIEFAKISIFFILKQSLHATYLLKLLDKMCKYEMDPTSIVEDTERTRFCPQIDRWTDGQGETSIPPFQLRWSGGYNNEDLKNGRHFEDKIFKTFSWKEINLFNFHWSLLIRVQLTINYHNDSGDVLAHLCIYYAKGSMI